MYMVCRLAWQWIEDQGINDLYVQYLVLWSMHFPGLFGAIVDVKDKESEMICTV